MSLSLGHLERSLSRNQGRVHWLGYAGTAAATVATSYFYSENQDAVGSFVQNKVCGDDGYVVIARQNFDEYCVKPVIDMWNTLTKRESLNNLSATLGELKASLNKKVDGEKG